ncbi:hypothetical protein [Asaia prunellae]|uniref:hypothetical protein n=1 Tax=Asaia prunellae TaxID=610245 RepID=UPI00131EDFB0|nr:hypothetical protein [Asaia prunellae]
MAVFAVRRALLVSRNRSAFGLAEGEVLAGGAVTPSREETAGAAQAGKNAKTTKAVLLKSRHGLTTAR